MKKTIIALTVFCIISVATYATGPSDMESIIKPISINANGVILCKTKFQQNSMGARRLMPVHYGWALIFSDGKMKEYPFHFFDSDSYSDTDLVFKHYNYLEKLFNQEIDWNNPPASLLPLIDKYKFSSDNVKKYLINKQMGRESFFKTYNLNVKDAAQLTLGNHHSTKFGDTVHILFVINNVIFLKNHMDIENCEKIPYNPVGARFDFYIKYQNELIDYDVFDITGIIKLKKN